MFDVTKRMTQARAKAADQADRAHAASGGQTSEGGERSPANAGHEGYWEKWPSGTLYERAPDGTYTGEHS